jgi:hypothetical protein
MSEVLDVELTMHAFRLMRSERYRTASEVIDAMKADFPEVDEERINRTLATLAAKLHADYKEER